MTTPLVQGGNILLTVRHVDATYDAKTRDLFHSRLSAELQSAVGSLKKLDWYPRAWAVECLKGVLALAAPSDDAPTYLHKIGYAGAKRSANSFALLAMKVMSPKMMAQKMPELWLHSHQNCGTLEVDVTQSSSNRIVVFMKDIQGYDYVVPCFAGSFCFLVEATGKKEVKSDLRGWSMDRPSPSEAAFDVTWL